MKDLKKGRGGVKAPLHWIPMWVMKGVARVFDYGSRKYAPGNWLRASEEDFPEKALSEYMSAAQRHWAAIQEVDPGGIANWDSVDEESGLPHIYHLMCSIIMLIGIAIKAGLLSADPGRGNDPPERDP